jgi:hypothetical protein
MPDRDDIKAVMSRILDQWKRDLRVAMPGKIVSYDAGTQLASVQPQIRRELRQLVDDRGRVFDDMPIIPAVPVCFPRFGPWFLSFPVQAGDHCLLIVCDQDLTRWRETGDVVDPYMPSSHHIADAVAVPGLFPEANALGGAHASNLVLGHDSGAQIHVTGGEIRLGGASASDPVARKSDLDAIKAYIDAHTHGGVTTGGGTSGAPAVPMPAPSGSSVVKAD